MNFRFLIAQLVGKSAEWFLRSVVHRGTNKPGELILKLCPDALARYQMPPLVICVTGTNGMEGFTRREQGLSTEDRAQ